MVILWCGPNSHLTLETSSTHFKKHHTTLNSTRSNDQTAPWPCEGAKFCGIRPRANSHTESKKQAHERPKMRPLGQQIIAAGWGIGTAGIARKNRRLLTLPDGAANRRQ